MTSQISVNSNKIQTGYPVSGQDNDSQGFRDNFTAIQAAFASAQTEITTLQTNGIFSADITQSTPVAVSNNLQKSVIYNAGYKQLNGIYYGQASISGPTNVSLANGPIQRFTITGNTNLNFTGWPNDSTFNGTWATIRIILQTDQQASHQVTFTSENSGVIKPATGFFTGGNTYITVNVGFIEVIEAWSIDGTHVFIKSVGEYSY